MNLLVTFSFQSAEVPPSEQKRGERKVVAVSIHSPVPPHPTPPHPPPLNRLMLPVGLTTTASGRGSRHDEGRQRIGGGGRARFVAAAGSFGEHENYGAPSIRYDIGYPPPPDSPHPVDVVVVVYVVVRAPPPPPLPSSSPYPS